MKHIIASVIVFLTLVSPAIAADLTPLDLKHRVQALHDMATNGAIQAADADKMVLFYTTQAHTLSPDIVTEQDLLAVPETANDSLAVKLVRFISLVNILWTFAVILGVGCFLYLCFDAITALLGLFAAIPLVVYEILLYAVSIAFIVVASRVTWSNYAALTGCLGIAGSLIVSSTIRKIKPNAERFFAILFVIYTAVALYYQSEMVAFIAVAAFMGLLGFSVAVMPMCYAIGFKDDESVPRATSAAIVMLAIFVCFRYYGVAIPYIGIFEWSALFIGSFVGYLGLIILSSKFYDSTPATYIQHQIIAMALGVGAIVIGTLLDIGQLQKIGGTFFCLYLIEKVGEIPAESATGYATVGLIIAGIIYVGAIYIQDHIAVLQPYLLF